MTVMIPRKAVTHSAFRGRNGQVWASTCPPTSRTHACNIRHTREGPVENAKDIKNEEGAITCFFDEDMLKQVVKHTHNRARRDLRAKGKNLYEWALVDLCEIRILLVYCTSLVCIVLLTNRFARCGHLFHPEGLYFLLLLAEIALSSLLQSYNLTVVKMATQMTSLLHFDVCGNSILKILENVML